MSSISALVEFFEAHFLRVATGEMVLDSQQARMYRPSPDRLMPSTRSRLNFILTPGGVRAFCLEVLMLSSLSGF